MQPLQTCSISDIHFHFEPLVLKLQLVLQTSAANIVLTAKPEPSCFLHLKDT